MRDNSISRALPRARAAAEQFERRYVQLAIACLPAGACCAVPPRRTCLDGRLVAFRGPRMAVWARSSTCPSMPAPPARRLLPRTGRFRVRVLLRAGRSRVRVLLRAGRSRVRVLLRAGRSRVPGARACRLLPHQPLSYQPLPHRPPYKERAKRAVAGSRLTQQLPKLHILWERRAVAAPRETYANSGEPAWASPCARASTTREATRAP